MCHINRHPLLLFLSITIPEFQRHSDSVGLIYSFQYPFFMAVEPGMTQVLTLAAFPALLFCVLPTHCPFVLIPCPTSAARVPI